MQTSSQREGALRYRLLLFVLPCPDYAIEREGTMGIQAGPSVVDGKVRVSIRQERPSNRDNKARQLSMEGNLSNPMRGILNLLAASISINRRYRGRRRWNLCRIVRVEEVLNQAAHSAECEQAEEWIRVGDTCGWMDADR